MSVSARLAPASRAYAPSKVDRYLAVVDAKLAHQRPREQRAFLSLNIASWKYRRRQFYATDGDSEPPGTDAFDLMHVIDALQARLAAVRCAHDGDDG